jgi:alpha-amylase
MNQTLFQCFHWYYPDNGSLWKFCGEQAAWWNHLGFTHIYQPPAYKSGFGSSEPGYAVYDLFDLGEFDQKGSLRTKYGTRDEYLSCIRKLQENNLKVIADVVLNHKSGGDEKETFPARLVNYENRQEFVDGETKIEAFTKYTFPGRKGRYSNFIWDWRTFSGVDNEWDGERRIYKILNGYGDHWEVVMGNEFGNFDYLMGADIEFRNEFVRAELKWWGKWYYETAKIDGFRLDAAKHITPSFYQDWIDFMKSELEKEFFIVAEFWHRDVDLLIGYYETLQGRTMMLDAPLHYNFYEASKHGNDHDLRTIFNGSFVQQRPQAAITFVDNHDTQPGQALESTIDYWFEPFAYALILLREQGTPCVFYTGLYGASYTVQKDDKSYDINLQKVESIEQLLLVRKCLAYGLQRDYFDHPNTVGWTREGVDEMQHSGVAIVLANGSDGEKNMELGKRHANKVFIDITGHRKEKISTDENGKAKFLANGRTISVWIREEAVRMIQSS